MIPNLSDNCPNLRGFHYNSNRFTFENILPHLAANGLVIQGNASNGNDILRYAPQAQIFTDTLIPRTAGESLAIDLGIDDTVSTNIYQWFKDGQPYALIQGSNELAFSALRPEDAGAYWVQVTNPNVPELALYSYTITIEVDCGEGSGSLGASICSGETYTWNGQGYTASGEYQQSFVTPEGCDSVATLSLEVHPAGPWMIDDVICPGEAYAFGTNLITAPGQYTQLLTSEAGCDSTVVLTLERVEREDIAAAGDTYALVGGTAQASLDLTANDRLPPGGWFAELTGYPSQGMAALSADGRLEYTLANTGFLGVDTFRYRLCSAACPGLCAEAPIRVATFRDCQQEIEANLPNGFTPDGDGVNDLFDPLAGVAGIGCLQNPQNASLTVFNRWGEVIFAPPVYAPWDGTAGHTGKIVPQGAYYFVLQFELEREVALRKVVHVFR